MPLGEYRPDKASKSRLRLATPGEPETLPLDLQLDLLVDGELPETDRRHLLEELDRPAAALGEPRWRDLAIRFLERQTEKQTTRALMAGNCILPAEFLAARRFWQRLYGWRTWAATAASLIIVATAALIYIDYPRPRTQVAAASDQLSVVLPGVAVGNDQGVHVVVPLVKNPEGDQSLFPASSEQNDSEMARRSVLIQPVTNGAVAIPVDQWRASFN